VPRCTMVANFYSAPSSNSSREIL